jgi:predicted transcriptional regulator
MSKSIASFNLSDELIHVLDLYCKNMKIHRSTFAETAIKNELLRKVEDFERCRIK